MFLETLRSPATLFALVMAVGLLVAAGIMEADTMGDAVWLDIGR